MFGKLFRKLTGTSRVGIEIRSGETSRTAFERMRSEYFGTDEWKELVSTDLETLQEGELGGFFEIAEKVLSMSPTVRHLVLHPAVDVRTPLVRLFTKRGFLIRTFLDAFDIVLSEESIATATSMLIADLDEKDRVWSSVGMSKTLTSICIIENEFDAWEAFNELSDTGIQQLSDHMNKVHANEGKSVPYSSWSEQS